MPSHQERVRRNYHNCEISSYYSPEEDVNHFDIKITKIDLATSMSTRDRVNWILSLVRKQLLKLT